MVKITEERAKDLPDLMRRVKRARNFPENTCGASRLMVQIADDLAKGKPSYMLQEEPQHCAACMLATVAALWEARTEIAELKAKLQARVS